jgi:lipocalin
LLLAAALAAGYKLYISANSTIPDDIVLVSGFELDRYLGKWFEAAG